MQMTKRAMKMLLVMTTRVTKAAIVLRLLSYTNVTVDRCLLLNVVKPLISVMRFNC